MAWRHRLLLPVLALALGLAQPGSAQQPGGADADPLAFLSRHWQLPIPLQGKPPARFSPLEASLHPESCATCHPAQFADWRTSFHARAMGPGVKGQLIEMLASDPASALQCYTCHAPLTEQQERLAEPGGRYPANHAFDAKLQTAGLTCAGCHVREHQRFGPPRRDGSLGDDALRTALPHGGVTRTPAFLRSEFCKDCHQFPADGYALNGKLLENTYNEWRAGPFAQAGLQCQDCHMPDRRHLWRGIHDPEMVRSGVTIALVTDKPRYRPSQLLTATLTITNSRVGHAFPSYVTPRVVIRTELRDREGRPVRGTLEERTVGRDVPLDLSRELADTRILPGASFVLSYRRVLDRPGLRLRVVVTVEPDHFYTRFFESVLAQGAGKGTAQIREALAATRRSAFVLYEKVLPLT
jgi:hypothetical protein